MLCRFEVVVTHRLLVFRCFCRIRARLAVSSTFGAFLDPVCRVFSLSLISLNVSLGPAVVHHLGFLCPLFLPVYFIPRFVVSSIDRISNRGAIAIPDFGACSRCNLCCRARSCAGRLVDPILVLLHLSLCRGNSALLPPTLPPHCPICPASPRPKPNPNENEKRQYTHVMPAAFQANTIVGEDCGVGEWVRCCLDGETKKDLLLSAACCGTCLRAIHSTRQNWSPPWYTHPPDHQGTREAPLPEAPWCVT